MMFGIQKQIGLSVIEMNNTKLNAYKKYGRSEANRYRKCKYCSRVFAPINSNCMYSGTFCSNECQTKAGW